MNHPNEDMDTRDTLSSSAGTSTNDPRPTSVNDNRLQPESGNDDDLPIDAGGTRTAAFDEGASQRDENRGPSAEGGQPSRH